MVGTQARRHMVAEILYYANDYIKMKTLAERLGVSYSTIRNDVDILSLTYNIISKAGFDGGVLLRVQRKKLRFLDADETASLLRIMRIIRNLPRCRRSKGCYAPVAFRSRMSAVRVHEQKPVCPHQRLTAAWQVYSVTAGGSGSVNCQTGT